MPLTADDIASPDGNIMGLRQGSTWAGVLLRNLNDNDNEMDLTVTTE